MKQNNDRWNTVLKFSWGHILAFVALIFIAYVTFMSSFYSNGGIMKDAVERMTVITAVLFVCFIGIQMLKATGRNFDTCIKCERILLCVSVSAFLVILFTSYNHFWNVVTRQKEIRERFTSAINNSRKIFDDYDKYADERIRNYDGSLQGVISAREFDKYNHDECNFADFGMQKDAYVHTLKLQLKSADSDTLRVNALKWIDGANSGASVWNAFLVGNIQEIAKAIEQWNDECIRISQPVMSNEVDMVGPVGSFAGNSEAVKKANEELSMLLTIYQGKDRFDIWTLLTGIVLFIFLLLPYFFQLRHTKSRVSLFSFLKKHQAPEDKKLQVPESQPQELKEKDSDKNTDTDIYTPGEF